MLHSPDAGPRVTCLGTGAILFEAPGATSLPTQQRIWALAREAQGWPEVREAVPGVNNLMLTLVTPPRRPEPLSERLLSAWAAAQPLPRAGRVVELPVAYGGEAGPHLAEVVAHTGLGVDEIVALHTAPIYPVFAIGSHPGYCYLGGMDPRLATPRRRVPLLRIPAGSVSIGGAQTGVSASDGPSGWNTIGRTEMCFFDHRRDPPVLLQPGDSIVFVAREVRS
jgi:KipI family sensor histidine kinase inhibitor